jgi:hypothetical protein
LTKAEETVNAKKAFEAYLLALQGVTIRHYHANNGCFAETKWLEAVKAHRPQQTVSFCGIGTHHQHDIAAHFVVSAHTIRMILPKRRYKISKRTHAP